MTLQIFSALRERAASQRLGIVAALLQPSPELVELFDDVILLRDGAEVYHGPRLALPQYLRDLGFHPPLEWTPPADGGVDGCGAAVALDDDDLNAADLADWLSEWVTYPRRRHRKDVARLRGSVDPSNHNGPPVTTEALVRAWKAHPLYAALLAPSSSPGALAVPSKAAQRRRLVHHPLVHLGHVTRRQALLLLRSWEHLGEGRRWRAIRSSPEARGCSPHRHLKPLPTACLALPRSLPPVHGCLHGDAHGRPLLPERRREGTQLLWSLPQYYHAAVGEGRGCRQTLDVAHAACPVFSFASSLTSPR